MRIIKLNKFDAFNQLYNEYEQNKDSNNDLRNLIFLFVGANDPQTKQSWCSDCRTSKPIIDKCIEDFLHNNQLALAIVDVGQRDEWKRNDNPFKLHKLNIRAIPTMISLKNEIRLVESECADYTQVSHLLSNSL